MGAPRRCANVRIDKKQDMVYHYKYIWNNFYSKRKQNSAVSQTLRRSANRKTGLHCVFFNRKGSMKKFMKKHPALADLCDAVLSLLAGSFALLAIGLVWLKEQICGKEQSR